MTQKRQTDQQIEALRQARREVDEAAARHAAEAERLRSLADDLDRRISRKARPH